jgi:hypothetical protein
MGYKCGAIGNILRNTLKTWGNATHKELIINDANHFPNHTGMNQFIYVIINS